MRLSVIGLGKLGLPMAALFASKGHSVTAIDSNPGVINLLNNGACPVCEPGLEELLNDGRQNIRFHYGFEGNPDLGDATFVIVPTPSRADGNFDNKYILSTIGGIGVALRNKKDYHLVVITSTVSPGSMVSIRQAIETVSEKRVGEDIGLCYNPEFIALGNVINGMCEPDALLIGESDKRAGDILAGIQKSILRNSPPVRRMSFANAEVAKLALNIYITTKISIANVLAEICDRIEGGNVDDVVGFIGLDKRIGSSYLRAGPGFGGPCFPRDNLAFIAQHGDKRATVIQAAVDTLNGWHTHYVAHRIMQIANKPDDRIAILGITYKPDTPVVDESPSLNIARQLVSEGYQVVIYDPMGSERAKAVLQEAQYTETAYDALRDADLAVIGTPWATFTKNLRPADFLRLMRTARIYDCWRIYNKAEMSQHGVEYHALGVNG